MATSAKVFSVFNHPPPSAFREAALDWSEWGSFGGAIEMCNNNGTCRKMNAGTMCPSYRATMDLCVSCKGCKRDCPTGVDMARIRSSSCTTTMNATDFP